jgi:hypothetical protein
MIQSTQSFVAGIALVVLCLICLLIGIFGDRKWGWGAKIKADFDEAKDKFKSDADKADARIDKLLDYVVGKDKPAADSAPVVAQQTLAQAQSTAPAIAQTATVATQTVTAPQTVAPPSVAQTTNNQPAQTAPVTATVVPTAAATA